MTGFLFLTSDWQQTSQWFNNSKICEISLWGAKLLSSCFFFSIHLEVVDSSDSSLSSEKLVHKQALFSHQSQMRWDGEGRWRRREGEDLSIYFFIISFLGNADQLQEAECVCVTLETNFEIQKASGYIQANAAAEHATGEGGGGAGPEWEGLQSTFSVSFRTHPKLFFF